ncbi:MAG: hypothetical protein KC502_11720 [Myxococcales bacterium]|nr:hypothetical protein [Myxococcales bacterium]
MNATNHFGANANAAISQAPSVHLAGLLPPLRAMTISASLLLAGVSFAAQPQTPTKKAPRCVTGDAGVFAGTRLTMRICRLPGRAQLRRTVIFRDATGRKMGQASTKPVPWPRTKPLPALGTIIDGPDPLWVLPRGFAAINLGRRRMELLFQTDGDRVLIAAVQRGQRVAWVTRGSHGCVVQSKGVKPPPCLMWMAVDFARGELLLRRQLPEAAPLRMGFGQHGGQRATWLLARQGASTPAWVTPLVPRPLNRPAQTDLPATLKIVPPVTSNERRRTWVQPR